MAVAAAAPTKEKMTAADVGTALQELRRKQTAQALLERVLDAFFCLLEETYFYLSLTRKNNRLLCFFYLTEEIGVQKQTIKTTHVKRTSPR